MNQSQTTRRIWITSTSTKIGFSSSDKTNYPFVAVQLENVEAGTYNLDFKLTLTSTGGLAQIYVVTREVYNAAVQAWLAKYDTQDSTIINKAFATLAEDHSLIYSTLENRMLNNPESNVLSCYDGTDASSEQSIGEVTFASNGNYVLVIQSKGPDSQNEADTRNVQIESLTLALPAAQVGSTKYYTVQDAVNAAAGQTVTLLRDVVEDAVDIKDGVTLDLNGKKLTADVIGQGKLTDSSAAAGVVISDKAPTCGVNADELLLETTNGYQIFDYTLTESDPVKAEDGKSVNFWFDVRFAETQAAAAYTAIAAGDSGFELTVDLSWENGSALPVRFGDGKSVADWASLMLQNPEYSFYICVEGLDSVTTAGTLKAAPKINGLQGSSTVEMAYDITVQ